MSDRPPSEKTALGAAFIFLLALAVYWPAIHGGFIWDDNSMLKDNLLVTQPNGLFSIWFSTAPVDYFPLTYSSLWLEWRLWGLNATGYHVTNVLLHAGSCVLLWRVLAGLKIPGAFFAALLFLVHPVNVESVAWIAERKNTLAMIFYMLSLWWFLRAEEISGKGAGEKVRFYLLSLVAFLLSLLSKTAGVMLPFILLGLVWWQRGRITKTDLLRSLPFFGVALIMGLVTIWFQYHRAIGEAVINNRDFWTRLSSAGWSVWFYLWKALWPVNLTFVYPEWTVDSHSLLSYVPGIALLGVLILLWRFRNAWGRPWLFALAYFVLSLFPVLGFFKMYFLRYSFVADHWQHFALPAVVTLMAAGLDRVSVLRVRQALGGILVAALAILTWQQSLIYRDEETLWRDTLQKNSRCWMAYTNLGLILKNQGKRDQAIAANERSLQIRPDQFEAYNNLGVIFYEQGKLDEAITKYRAALAAYRNFADAHVNLGTVLDLRGQSVEAMEEYRTALRLSPNNAQAHNNLGCLLLASGNLEEAMGHFQETLKATPGSVEALVNLAGALLELGRAKEATPYLAKAVEIDPRHANAHLTFGNALLATGQFSQAIVEYTDAWQIQPDLARAHFKAGMAWLGLKKTKEAMNQFLIVLGWQPNSAETHYQLAVLLAREKQTAAAIEHYKAAIRHQPGWTAPLNSLAWLLATHPDAQFRDGKLAVELAQRACQATDNKDAGNLDTLAAAYAEAGNFPRAIEVGTQAEEMANLTQEVELKRELAQRLEGYRQGKAFRE